MQETRRSVNRYTLLLIPLGILVNFLGAQLALYFKLPLFLDSIGTIFCAALGGYLPGIFVGFFSNVFNGIADPITLYYGIISILIAAATTFFAKRKAMTKCLRALLLALFLACIGGGLGSVLTWLLYGFDFGNGISAPFAIMLNGSMGMPKFLAQFVADMGIDLLDKLITVAAVFVLLKVAPQKLKDRTELGYLYQENASDETAPQARTGISDPMLKRSLKNEVVLLIVATALILGTLATFISSSIYNKAAIAKYEAYAGDVASLMCQVIDADKIEGYLSSGVMDESYLATKANLAQIKACFPDIQYMYVYQIHPDACHVVFDIDTAELPGAALGALVAYEDAFVPYRDTLLSGGEIDPIVSNGYYGWLLTAYKPIIDSAGKCVAYAATDIDMDGVITDRYVFVIRMAALLFGATIIITLFAVLFAERSLVEPINAMTQAAEQFAYDGADKRLQSSKRISSLNIQTGDEVERLYHALNQTVNDMAAYITDINEQAELITKMQDNIILAFANMVENRDVNTGEHVKHTAAYVRIIAEELARNGLFPDILTKPYIDQLVRSAPLHDVGKIKISDTLLNKPGKLTNEEFAIMKTHTTEGKKILLEAMKNINSGGYLQDAAAMAESHHERWDGQGYPEGLRGEEIPLCSRIMAVADVFDALISRRCYKEPIPFDEAVSIIDAESGSHFDPVVVRAFVSASDLIRNTL